MIRAIFSEVSGLGGYCALVEEELPAIVAEYPDGGTVGDGDRRGGAVGGERHILGQLLDVVVVKGGVARFAGEHGIDGLLTVEDAAGAAELPEILGQKRDQDDTVGLSVGVEEALFKRVEMILKLRVGHDQTLQLLYGWQGDGFQLAMRHSGFYRIAGAAGVRARATRGIC